MECSLDKRVGQYERCVISSSRYVVIARVALTVPKGAKGAKGATLKVKVTVTLDTGSATRTAKYRIR